MENFKTAIKGVGVSILRPNRYIGLPDDVLLDVSSEAVEVSWGLEIDMRSWGVKTMSISITEAVATWEWEVADEELETSHRQHLIAIGARLERDEYWRGEGRLRFTPDEIDNFVQIEDFGIKPADADVTFGENGKFSISIS